MHTIRVMREGTCPNEITASVFVSWVIQLQRPVDPFCAFRRGVRLKSSHRTLFHTDVMVTYHGLCVNSSEMSHAAAVPALAGTPLDVGRLFRTVVDNVLTLLSFENLVRRTQ